MAQVGSCGTQIMNEIYKQAKYWISLGVAVIPVFYKSKQPKIRWNDYTEQLPGMDDVARWFAFRYTNAAVITGWEHLCIIDFDDMKAFHAWERWADDMEYRGKRKYARRLLEHTRMTFSARGVHLYTFCPDAINLKLPGIDILADRKYALIPPSIHPSGAQYRLERDCMPISVPSIMDLFPAEVIEPAVERALHPYPSPTEQQPKTAEPYDPWDSAAVEFTQTGNGSVVEDIKARYRIQDFFPDAIHSGGAGRWMLARCPFHNDRSPSLSIDTENQTCRCLASHDCTPLPLDVIGVYAKLHHLTNTDAIIELSKGL